MGDLDGEGAAVEELVVVEAGEGAAGDVADDVSAGAFGAEADGGEGVDDLDGGRQMVSQWNWMFWRVVMSARLRAYFLVRLADDAELVRW